MKKVLKVILISILVVSILYLCSVVLEILSALIFKYKYIVAVLIAIIIYLIYKKFDEYHNGVYTQRVLDENKLADYAESIGVDNFRKDLKKWMNKDIKTEEDFNRVKSLASNVSFKTVNIPKEVVMIGFIILGLILVFTLLI